MSTNSLGLDDPIQIARGGTGANTAPGALVSLGALALAGGTMTGPLILSADPTVALQAATKQYVDSVATGLPFKEPCYASTTANLVAVYSNGAAGIGATLTEVGNGTFGTDSTVPPVNSRILVQFQTNDFENGIYDLTNAGSAGTSYVLTRSTDFDSAAEIPQGAWTIIQNGTLYAVTSWVQTQTVTTIGTDPILFTQFTAGVGANLTLSNLTSPTAINQDLTPGLDADINLGAQNKRYIALYTEEINTGQTLADKVFFTAYNTNTLADVVFATLTAGNPPTFVLASAVTATTQAALDGSTKLATTAYADAAAAAAQAASANPQLSNLSATAVNTTIKSDTDLADDLGAPLLRWDNLYVSAIDTGHLGGNTLEIGAWDVDGGVFVPFILLTANNTPTCALASAVTAVTQIPLTNNTTIATTAYVDAATGGGSGANTALSNLASVAINTTLISDTDVTDDLGSAAKRWRNVLASTIQTGTADTQTVLFQAYNTSGSYTTFATLTAGATPTFALASAVTAVTQPANDNSTKIATTAYADAQAAAGANVNLSNLSSTAINTSLVPGTDNAIDLGDGTHRFKQLFGARVSPGTTSGNTLIFSGRNVGGTSDTTFMTITSDTTTPTCVLASAVTATTQTIADNTTKLATTAYIDLYWPLAVTRGGTGLASTTANQILYSSASNTIAGLATANNSVLVTSAGGVPSLSTSLPSAVQVGVGSLNSGTSASSSTYWRGDGTWANIAGASGGLVWLATATASASATLSFDNVMTSTYDNYLLLYSCIVPATNAVTTELRVGTGATPTYQASNYTGSFGGNNQAGAIQNAATSTFVALSISSRTSNSSTGGSSGSINITNVNDATNYKQIFGPVTYRDSSSSYNYAMNCGQQWGGATVLTSVQLLMSSGNIASGTAKLFGIQN